MVRKCKCYFFESIPKNGSSGNIFCARKPDSNDRIMTCTNDFKRSSKVFVKRSDVTTLISNPQNHQTVKPEILVHKDIQLPQPVASLLELLSS